MTIQELFRKVDFDSLVPILDKITSHDTPLTQAAYFRMAYDEMLLMTPGSEDGGFEPFRPERREDGRLNGSSGYELEGDFWQYSLGREIVLSEGPAVSDEELAAWLLWSMTFYGYSKNYREMQGDPDTLWLIQKQLDLHRRHTAAYGRISRKMLRSLDITGDEYFAAEQRAAKNCLRRNRAKRMRDHRQDILMKKYERQEKVAGTISRILEHADDFEPETFRYLYDTKWISDNCYHSETADEAGRVDYLINLVQKYGGVDYSEFDSIVIIATADIEHALSDEDLKKLGAFAEQLGTFKREELHYCTIRDFGTAAELLIVASRDRSR